MKMSKKSKPYMKSKPQKKKAQLKADQAAILAITSGDVMKDLESRKNDQDSRTLYIRFPNKLPQTVKEIKELHSDIKFVRTPRIASKQKAGIGYAFIEFGDSEECKAAKDILATTQFKDSEVYVDFVGENSKGKKIVKPATQLNPTRLLVSGLAKGVDKSNLQEMFPKACSACIPSRSKKRGTSYGFVEFKSAVEAKAAFDAAQDLTILNHKITVLFAESKQNVQMKKAEKRKSNTDERKASKEEINVIKKEKTVTTEDDDIIEDNKVTGDVLNLEEEKNDHNKFKSLIKNEKVNVKEENLIYVFKGEHDNPKKDMYEIFSVMNEKNEGEADEVRDPSVGDENVQVGGYEDDD